MPDDELLRRPIVILGAPRSGTTLISQLLKHHPRLYLANEPRILWKFGNDRRSDLLAPEHATEPVRAEIRRRLAGEVRDAGRTRLVEKTPSNSLRAPFVDRVLPGAVYINMMRDGRQSVLSIREFWRNHAAGVPSSKLLWQRIKELRPRQAPHYAKEFVRRVAGKLSPGLAGVPVWGPRVPGIEDWARDRDLLAVAALQWRTCVEIACADGRRLPEDRYTECRLEEFDEAELGRLMAFCGLEPSSEVSAAFQAKFDKKAPSGRSQNASAEDLARVDELVAPTNAWLASLPDARRHRAGDA